MSAIAPEIGILHIHYKGGKYLVVQIAETHNHNGDCDVVYYAIATNKFVTRPMYRDSRNEDAWFDMIEWPDGVRRTRFVPENDLPPRK